MNTTINRTELAQRYEVIEQTAASDAARVANYAALSEFPGLLFGLVTLAYIVSSLFSLA